MYLFVFIFLLLSIIGLYTQLYTLQIAKMLANQTAIAQTMKTWHGAATKFARDNVKSGAIVPATVGCMVTSGVTTPLTGIGSCASMLNYSDTNYLPGGYQPEFRWYSVLYKTTGGTNYLITVAVPPGGAATDPVVQPKIGFSTSEIWQQIRKSGEAKENYGQVQMVVGVPKFVTPAAPVWPAGSAPPSYDLPTCGVNCMPAGTVGFISPL